MLSHQLIHAIEGHCDQITSRVLAEMPQDPEVSHLRQLPESELREWGCTILKNLGAWIVSRRDPALARRYELLGRVRFEESIPLHEVVRGLHVLKDRTIDYVRENGFPQTAAEVYAEEELEYLVTRFFDRLVYYFVRGYEKALRSATRLAA